MASVKFHEKLRRRVEELGLNKAKAAREVGLPESTISNYIADDRSLPRIDIAVKIAKAIRVPLQWLADDDAEWPPPDGNLKADVGVAVASNDQLILELARRSRLEMLKILGFLERAEKIPDWHQAQDSLPNDDLRGLINGLVSSYLSVIPSIEYYMKMKHKTLPGSDRDLKELDFSALRERIIKVLQSPGFPEACEKRIGVKLVFTGSDSTKTG